MDTKQKKQLITFSLAGAVLLAGLVAGFLVVQNQQFIQNKASTGPISCTPLLGKCTVPASGSTDTSPYVIKVKVQNDDNSLREIATSEQNATQISFPAETFKKYVCEVVSTTNDTCKQSTEMTGPVCLAPDSGETVTAPPAIPTTISPTEVPKTITTPTDAPKTLITPTSTATVLTPTTKPSVITPSSTVVTTTGTATPTTKPGSPTATSIPPTGGTGGSGITPTSLPTNAPTATAAAQATKAAATATQAAAQTVTANPSATKTASTTSLPASGNIHPALIFGMLSVFIIVLGLLF